MKEKQEKLDDRKLIEKYESGEIDFEKELQKILPKKHEAVNKEPEKRQETNKE